MPVTNAELAVLSLVVERPRHGYEIEQVIEERGMRGWTDIGFSSIYYVLGKLERSGLVEAAADAGGKGPARKVYRPTAEGYSACGTATIAALSTPAGGNRPFLLGLSNIVALPAEDALAAVRTYRDGLEETLAAVRAKRTAEGDVPWFVDAVFDYSVSMLDAERAWVARFSDELADRGRKVADVPRKMKPFTPEIVDAPARTMAVARTQGDPTEVGARVFPALYGAVYGLKFALKKDGVEYKMEAPRARWFNGPDWKAVPRDQWRAEWAIPVPDGTTELVQKDPTMPVTVETWEYGTVAQILHVGTYAEEEPTIVQLQGFIAEQGYEIAGPHEEEYLSRPGVKEPKTIVRYQVRKKA
jgi:hypothetical protein